MIGRALPPPQIQEIHLIFWIDADHRVHRVVASIGRYSIIGPAVDVEGRTLGRVDVVSTPTLLEVASGFRCRPLLIERAPIPRQLCRLLSGKKRRLTVFVVPEPCT